MVSYEVIYGYNFKDLLDNIEILRKEYNMPYEVINFQETDGRFVAFLKLE